MINPWFKFYGSEYLSDPKIGSLTPQERSCWITLMCLSSTSSVAGIVEYLTVEVLLEKSGIRFDPYHPEEWDSCISILEKFERMKMIKKNENGSVEIVNWNKRQESAMTVTERVRKFRMKSRENKEDETDVTKGNETANDRIEKKRKEKSIIPEQSSVEIPELIKSFESINPASKRFYGNTTQRNSCKALIEAYGYERVKRVIEKTLPQTNGLAYFPTIITPLQLLEKWPALESAIMKHKNKVETDKNKKGICL